MPLTTGAGGYNPNFSRPDGMDFGLGGVRGRQVVDLTGGRPSNQAGYIAQNPATALGGFQQYPGRAGVQPTGPYPQGQQPQVGQPQQPQPQGQPAWMNTPQGQEYMAKLVAANPQAAMQANPNAWNAHQFGLNAGGNTAPPTGLIGSEQALMQALQGATNTINGAASTADGFLAQAGAAYDPYLRQGTNALGLQADLSGANGQAAFDNAFVESPVQQFLRQQGERSVTQNAAALGGLRGGNVMKELTRYGTGVAGTQLQQQVDNLNTITGLGFDAAGKAGNILADRGQNAYTTGANVATAIGNVGQTIASDRMQTGRDLSANIGGTTSALAELANEQGAGLSDMTGAASGNLANILAGYGSGANQDNQALATILANILTGQGGNVAGLSGIPGTQQTGGILGDIGSLAGGIGTGMAGFSALGGAGAAGAGAAGAGAASGAGAAVLGFSDRRLKTSVRKVGETASGTNIYSWSWTEEAKPIVGNQPAFGVMADEVDPAITMRGADGFLRVDYSRVV